MCGDNYPMGYTEPPSIEEVLEHYENRIEKLEAALKSIVDDWDFCKAHGPSNRSEAYYDTAKAAL